METFASITTEAEVQSNIHAECSQRLQVNIDAVIAWKEQNFTKKGSFSSGTKEAEEMQKQFETFLKPWNDATANAKKLRDNYHQ